MEQPHNDEVQHLYILFSASWVDIPIFALPVVGSFSNTCNHIKYPCIVM